ncbi:MAG: hypothetical protein ACQERB_05625 [Promethearchaeati archaeon]
MIIKLKLKKDLDKKYSNIVAWIERDTEFEKDIVDVLEFFNENIKIKQKRRFHKYYKIITSNLAVMISFISTILEIIPETLIIEEYEKN